MNFVISGAIFAFGQLSMIAWTEGALADVRQMHFAATAARVDFIESNCQDHIHFDQLKLDAFRDDWKKLKKQSWDNNNQYAYDVVWTMTQELFKEKSPDSLTVCRVIATMVTLQLRDQSPVYWTEGDRRVTVQ